MSFCATIVVPMLNEIACAEQALARLQPYREAGCQLIVVDGGSDDGCQQVVQAYADQLVVSEPGRSRQMNAALALAQSHWLLFLHIDTELPSDPSGVLALLNRHQLTGQQWGYFKVKLAADGFAYRVIEWFMNRRSAITHVATGDQLLFCKTAHFKQLGGFSSIPIMEDVEFCKRLRRYSRPLRMPYYVKTSARRWQRHGVLKTVLLMWRLRLAYWLGVKPQRLLKHYDV